MLSVGRYQLLETLGEGGMGVVYKAFDPLIQRTVAVKLISARLVESPELRERFFSEARAAGQLSHRNIVTIFDLGEDNGHPYFAMEYLEGRNLRVRLQSFERMSLARKLEVMSFVCDGLAYAHTKGVTHRDIKPANIFITDAGEVKILDFGLARLPASELTHSKTFIGTLNYMAPEQIAGEKTDRRTDIFAVGVVFYEMLSGRSPFEADSVAALLNKILREDPPPLGSLDAGIPPELNALVGRAMAKAREDRYQSLTDLLIDLAACRTAMRDSDSGSASRLDLEVTRELPGSASRHLWTGNSPQPQRPPSGSPPQRPPSGSQPHRPGSGSSQLPPVGGPTDAAGRYTPVPSLAARLDDSAAPPPGSPMTKPWGWRWWGPIAAVALTIGVLAVAGSQLSWPRRPDERAVPQPPATGVAGNPPSATATSADPAPAPPPRTEAPPVSGPTTRPAPAGAGAEEPKGTVGRRPPPAAPPNDRAAPKSRTESTAAAARAEASAARTAAELAMQQADAANARDLAPSTYRSAQDRGAAVAELLALGQFAEAAAKAREAADLFRRAEFEARAEQGRRELESRRADARPPGPPGSGAPQPVPAPPPEWKAPEPDVALPPPESRPPHSVDRGSAPAAPTASDPAIRQLLARYAEALESRSLASLKRIWPGLSGAQERALREEFEHARSISVDLGDPAVETANGTVTVTCRRRYSLHTMDGHSLESRNTSIFTIRRQGSGWVIDNVRHDASR